MTSTPTAHFIAGPALHSSAGQAAPYLRSEFDVAEGLVSARLRVTGYGVVEAHLNGAVVGDEVLCPGWTSYDHRLVVSGHDVLHLLRPGRNAVGAMVGEGWAVGRIGFAHGRNRWADRPAVWMELELTYADRVDRVVTGEGWRTATGAVLSDGIYDGETYDARLEPLGWDEPGFDDSSWTPAAVVDRSTANLIDPVAPPIRRTEELPVRSITTSPGGAVIVDFGQVFSGWIRLRVDGPAGATIVLRHTELLVGGEPEYEPNRTAEATDRYTLRGGGPEVWEPRFTFHGFRYCIVEGWPGELVPDDLTGVVIHSDLERSGWFECSDERVNQLHRNTVWSWRGNSVGLPTDCPQRDERLGWTGDINAFAPTAAFVHDVRDFLASWLQDLAAEQADLGQVPMVVPDALGGSMGPTALWGDVAVSLPWTLYEQYGDVDVIERQYPSMRAFVESVVPLLDPDGCWTAGYQFGDWVDPDSPPDNPAKAKAEPGLVATAHFSRVVRQMAGAARLLGRLDDAERYDALADRVRAGFHREWVTPSGRLANECQTSYALAICFDLFDADQEQRAGDRLVELVRAAGHRISTGFAGTPWILHALSRTGHDDDAYRMLLQTSPPSFLYPITMGATTIWERWDAVLPDGRLNSTGMTSLNHYALGAAVDWLHRRVAGIRPLEPGYRRVEVAPRPGGGLTWATASVARAGGTIRVRWADDGDRRTVEVDLPDGVSGRVVLPDHPDALVAEVGPGTHQWTYVVEVATGLSLDTPFEVLRADELVWTELVELFGTLMAGVPNLLDHVAGAAPDLRTALPHTPGVTDATVAAVESILARSTAG